jgi:hypothetical protein
LATVFSALGGKPLTDTKSLIARDKADQEKDSAADRLHLLPFRLAARIADNRMVAGVHFPTDSAGGAVTGFALCQAIVAYAMGDDKTNDCQKDESTTENTYGQEGRKPATKKEKIAGWSIDAGSWDTDFRLENLRDSMTGTPKDPKTGIAATASIVIAGAASHSALRKVWELARLEWEQ